MQSPDFCNCREQPHKKVLTAVAGLSDDGEVESY